MANGIAKRCKVATTIQDDTAAQKAAKSARPSIAARESESPENDRAGAYFPRISSENGRLFFDTRVWATRELTDFNEFIALKLRSAKRVAGNGTELSRLLNGDAESWAKKLEGFEEVTVAYKIFGENGKSINAIPEDKKDKCILLFHALTGGPDADEWFPNYVDEMTSKGFIVVVPNVLGSCHGSTGISRKTFEDYESDSTNPENKVKKVGLSQSSIHDMDTTCRAYDDLRKKLIGKNVWASAVGTSMGGRFAIRYSHRFPDKVKNLMVVASDHKPTTTQKRWCANAFQTAFAEASFRGGRYLEGFPAIHKAIGKLLNLIRRTDNDMFESAEKLIQQGNIKGLKFDPDSKEPLKELITLFRFRDLVTRKIKQMGYLPNEDIEDSPYRNRKLQSIDEKTIELIDYLIMHALFAYNDMSDIELTKMPATVGVVVCKGDLLVERESQLEMITELETKGKTVYVLEVSGTDVLKATQAQDIPQFPFGHDSFLVNETDGLTGYFHRLVLEGRIADFAYGRNSPGVQGTQIDTAKLAKAYVRSLSRVLPITPERAPALELG